MNNGFIKLHRCIREWDYYDNPVYLKIWLEILLSASHKKTTYKGEKLQPGEFTTSRTAFAERIKVPTSHLRSALKVLTKNQQITCETNRQRTKITVLNWENYQIGSLEDHDSNRNGSRTDSKRTTIKKKEERNKKKEVYTATDFFPSQQINEWVGYVSPGILEKWSRFDPSDLEKMAQKAREYQLASGKKYKSIAQFVNNWFNRSEEYKFMEAEWEFSKKYD